MRCRPHRAALALVLLVTPLVASCSDTQPPSKEPTAPQPTPAEGEDLGIKGTPTVLVGATRDKPDQPAQLGSAPVDVTVSSTDGGVVSMTQGVGDEAGLRYPRYTSAEIYPRAVVVAHNATAADEIDPQYDDFSYGADFKLDDRSAGRENDNGNNVFQRGLSSDPVMFKLDVDEAHRPGCTIKGRAGSVTVYSAQPVTTQTWYRVRCDRTGDRVIIYVGEYLPSGRVTAIGRERAGRIGAVAFPDPEVPISVGGKVARDGTIIQSAGDQFNGEIASPFLQIRS